MNETLFFQKSLEGATVESISGKIGDKTLTFYMTSGKSYEMYHIQDCCEVVRLEDVTGDLEDLVGAPILRAEESSESKMEDGDSSTWTFYKIATRKGYVTLRWLGESSGYYSEEMSFRETTGR